MNQLTIAPDLRCFSGRVSLFRFIQAPPPGAVIGTLTLNSGQQIPLVQTRPTPLGGTSLASVDGQFATLCGRFTQVSGQTALDVVIVNPGAPSPTGTPGPLDCRSLLILMLLFLLTGRRFSATPANLAGVNLGPLLSTPSAQALLGQMGFTAQQVLQVLGQ